MKELRAYVEGLCETGGFNTDQYHERIGTLEGVIGYLSTVQVLWTTSKAPSGLIANHELVMAIENDIDAVDAEILDLIDTCKAEVDHCIDCALEPDDAP